APRRLPGDGEGAFVFALVLHEPGVGDVGGDVAAVEREGLLVGVGRAVDEAQFAVDAAHAGPRRRGRRARQLRAVVAYSLAVRALPHGVVAQVVPHAGEAGVARDDAAVGGRGLLPAQQARL